MPDRTDYFIWDVDRQFHLFGTINLRYYSLFFLAGIFLGYYVWRWQMRKLGAKEDDLLNFLVYGTAAILVGARIAHCLFYDPRFFLSNPWEILKMWKGGLASHGAAVGLIAALWVFARKFKYPFGEVMDRLTMSVCVAAVMVRLGNFMNSEIVGRITDLPWGVRFMHFTDGGAYPRHPVQLYEAALAGATLLILLILNRRLGDERPRWLFTGVFFSVYFGGRFFIEYFKEYQAFDPSVPFTMGQLLSLPFAVIGLFLIFRQLKYGRKEA